MYPDKEFNRRLGGIRERFVSSLYDVDAELRRHERRAAEPEKRRAALSAISQQAHRLRGLAPILGLADLGACALDVEESIMAVSDVQLVDGECIAILSKVTHLRGEVAKLINV